MKPVLCFGEALIDFLHQDVMEQDGLSLPSFRQYPGGAPANAAVAVAKLGGRAKFAGQVGQDAFGDFLQNALQQYGVDVTFLVRHPSAKTALAFVMLDETGDRSFCFYRDDSADVLFDIKQVGADWFSEKPILHFCSNTLTTERIAKCTAQIVSQARSSSSVVSFDVNLRHNLWPAKQASRSLVSSLVFQSDLVKFSKDELLYLSENNPEPYLNSCLEKQCKLLVVTDGAGDIEYYARGHSGIVSPPKIKVLDTTAGGDGFVGGMLYVLSQLDNPIDAFENPKTVSCILEFASCCGALAVSQPGAFPALPNNQAVLQMLEQQNYDVTAVNQLLDGQVL